MDTQATRATAAAKPWPVMVLVEEGVTDASLDVRATPGSLAALRRALLENPYPHATSLPSRSGRRRIRQICEVLRAV